MAMQSGNEFTRRKFIQTCAMGTAALASGSILGGCVTPGGRRAPVGPAGFRLPLDRGWRFGGKLGSVDALKPGFDDRAFCRVTLPHCVSKLSWEGWTPDQWQAVWLYRRHFTLPKQFRHSRIFLDFDGVMAAATPVINGRTLSKHLGGYLPFSYELTGMLNTGLLDQKNTLAVALDANWLSTPPDGSPKGPGFIDFLEPGGLVRSVSLRAVPQIFIADVFAKPVAVLTPDRRLEVTCTIDAAVLPAGALSVKVELRDGDRNLASAAQSVTLEKTGAAEATLTLANLGEVKLWDVESPQLYEVVTTLLVDGQPLHDHRTRIGFREASFKLDGFYLNGKRLQLFGLNRHELYPYTGFAMPPRVMRRDAEMLRREFNCNVVRCSHYPQSPAFLDACDELGLLVWEEMPGWHFIGDEAWQDLAVRNVQDMVRRDRNRPSVIIWGVRINESANKPAFYARATAAAKALDDTRPASGAMDIYGLKDWSEDVYAFNDYHHDDKTGVMSLKDPLPGVPFLLTEAVGQLVGIGPSAVHKYRRAAEVDLQMKQAIYHAQVHDLAAANPRCAGVIAWCAFDYGSLQNAFNSIKCPGVADTFRIPKLGASFYQAQVSPAVRPVIQPNFYWDLGPRTPTGPGRNVAIFSNCDRLEIFIGDKPAATLQPDREHFPNLAYPPFFCDLVVPEGKARPELRIDGYAGDQLVLSKSYSSDTAGDELYFAADDAELTGDGADATRLVFRVTDKFGAQRVFANGAVAFEITGPGMILGDNPFGLLDDSGGAGAVWIKALPGGSGPITVKATHTVLGAKSVTVNVRPAAASEI